MDEVAGCIVTAWVGSMSARPSTTRPCCQRQVSSARADRARNDEAQIEQPLDLTERCGPSAMAIDQPESIWRGAPVCRSLVPGLVMPHASELYPSEAKTDGARQLRAGTAQALGPRLNNPVVRAVLARYPTPSALRGAARLTPRSPTGAGNRGPGDPASSQKRSTGCRATRSSESILVYAAPPLGEEARYLPQRSC